MLPLQLSIEGLYSYQKKQTIDFTALTEAGLFGIFGVVGSGKSSVLEAIGFVLYGETERLNKTDKRSYNMLNLKSNKAAIDFEFLNYQNRKFKFTAEWSRKKNFDETRTLSRAAYEWKISKWVPLDSADAEKILDISYNNFRRTIIIPQGKFKEFLDLKGKDRSVMMKEIFRLEKFDLSAKVSALQSATTATLNQLKGRLSGFENISPETIVFKETQVDEAKQVVTSQKKQLEDLEAEFKVINELKANFEELENKKNTLAKLLIEKPKMDALQAEVEEYEKVERIFGTPLATLRQSTVSLADVTAQFKSTEEKFTATATRIEATEEVLLHLKPQFDQLQDTRNKVLDLNSIIRILNLNEPIQLLNVEIKEIETKLSTIQLQLEEDKVELVAVRKEVQGQRANRTDSSILVEVGQWFVNHHNGQENLKTAQSRQIRLQNERATAVDAFHALNWTLAEWKSDFTKESELLTISRNEFETTKQGLVLAKGLAQFSHSLVEGESCPLCGALEHPHPMHSQDVSRELAEIDQQLQEIIEKEKALKDREEKAKRLELTISNLDEQLAECNNDIDKLIDNEKNHLARFIWESFSPTNYEAFEAKRMLQQDIETSIQNAEKKESLLQKELDTTNESIAKYTAEKAALNTKLTEHTTTIANEKSQLRALDFKVYENKSIAEIQKEHQTLENDIQRIEKEYQLKLGEVEEGKKELAGLQGQLTTQKDHLTSFEKLLAATNKSIAQLLSKNGFDDLKIVEIILSKTLNVEEIKRQTSQFLVDLQTINNAIDTLELLLHGKVFDSTTFEDVAKRLTDTKLKVEEQLKIFAALESELNTMKKELEDKADLLDELSQLQSRADNLSTLANMFSGSGFVNYVSTIYLQILADIANVRFHRMTKNQLSLQINASNEFEVIDYLNNGASRSVKTLSGGQGFQASLCLALALAESAPSLNKNSKNFFFIDEGFGTQDQENVAVVFETLQSLNKENRIVGIISHVTELQERIPRSITVIKDEDRGSELVESWSV